MGFRHDVRAWKPAVPENARASHNPSLFLRSGIGPVPSHFPSWIKTNRAAVEGRGPGMKTNKGGFARRPSAAGGWSGRARTSRTGTATTSLPEPRDSHPARGTRGQGVGSGGQIRPTVCSSRWRFQAGRSRCRPFAERHPRWRCKLPMPGLYPSKRILPGFGHCRPFQNTLFFLPRTHFFNNWIYCCPVPLGLSCPRMYSPCVYPCLPSKGLAATFPPVP